MKVNDQVLSYLTFTEYTDPDTGDITPEHSIYFGPEMKYFGSLECSNNNNLEEFYLMGTDKITSYQHNDENNKDIEEIEFRTDNGNEIQYYILTKEKFYVSIDDIQVRTDMSPCSLVFNNQGEMEYSAGSESIIQSNSSTIILQIIDNNLVIPYNYKEVWTLKYKNGNTIEDISQKEILNIVSGTTVETTEIITSTS